MQIFVLLHTSLLSAQIYLKHIDQIINNSFFFFFCFFHKIGVGTIQHECRVTLDKTRYRLMLKINIKTFMLKYFSSYLLFTDSCTVYRQVHLHVQCACAGTCVNVLKQLGLPFSPESFKFSEHWFLQNCFRLKLLGTRTALKIGVKGAVSVIYILYINVFNFKT